MTKREFLKATINMDNPILSEGDDCMHELLSCYLTIKDDHHKIELPCVRLTHKAHYDNPDKALRAYYKREKSMKLKFERWMHAAFGNYCTSQLKFDYY